MALEELFLAGKALKLETALLVFLSFLSGA